MRGKQVRGIAALAVAVGSLLPVLLRPLLPAGWLLRLLLDSFLPWSGAAFAVAAALAISTLAPRVIAACLVPVAIWAVMFVPRILPLDGNADDSAGTISVATQNIGADAQAIDAILATVTAAQPQVIVLEEVAQGSADHISAVLAADGYTNSTLKGTVGVWSTLPISHVKGLDLGLGWKRALRLTVASPAGDVRIYAVHAASVRLSGHTERDAMLAALTQLVRSDDSARLVVAGDFNAAIDDQALQSLTSVVTEPRLSSGGFGFTWPAVLPVTRPDHIFVRGLTATEHVVLASSGSDHLGVVVAARSAG